MSYKALYRTYRPSTFAQVAGQQHIVKTLSNALKENKIVKSRNIIANGRDVMICQGEIWK